MTIKPSITIDDIARELGVSKTGTLGIPEFGTKFVRGILEETKPTLSEELFRISDRVRLYI